MEVVNISVKELRKNGINNLEEWLKNPNNIYIGRDMSRYVKGASTSKWQNPFNLKKYNREQALELYENYIRNGDLYNQLDELKNKNLGCRCKPLGCHGDILIKLINEKNNIKKN